VLAMSCTLLLAVYAGSAAGAAHAPSPVCGSSKGKTLALDKRARVYSLPLRGPLAERDPDGARLIGCLRGNEHTLRLGTTVSGNSGWNPLKGAVNPEVAAVAAPFAAYSTSLSGIDFNRAWAIVRNLETGEVLQTADADPHGGVEQSSTVTDMAVRHSGTVAWISQGKFVGGGRSWDQVAYSAPEQEVVILDEGKAIGLRSLEIRGSRVTWLDEGGRRAAEMP
jgi:hypothetical protein